jgi:hypothetical protein
MSMLIYLYLLASASIFIVNSAPIQVLDNNNKLITTGDINTTALINHLCFLGDDNCLSCSCHLAKDHQGIVILARDVGSYFVKTNVILSSYVGSFVRLKSDDEKSTEDTIFGSTLVIIILVIAGLIIIAGIIMCCVNNCCRATIYYNHHVRTRNPAAVEEGTSTININPESAEIITDDNNDIDIDFWTIEEFPQGLIIDSMGDEEIFGFNDWPDCTICLEKLNPFSSIIAKLSCGHKYHRDCISNWFRTSHHCPNCRRPSAPPINLQRYNASTCRLETSVCR